MAAYIGRNMVLKSGTGVGATLITQCRTLDFTVNHEQVEITNKDSLGWQTFLENAGTKGVQVSVAGIVDNTTAFEAFQTSAQAGSIAAFRIEYADTDIIEASFHISNYAVSSGFNNEQTFTATLNSSGAVTFTNA